MPYLTEDIVLYVNPSVLLGKKGDEVRVIDKRGHVLLVQDMAISKPAYSITTKSITDHKDNQSPESVKITTKNNDNDSNKGRMERSAPGAKGSGAQSRKRTPKDIQNKAVPEQSLSLFG
ncbi:hypothetical protein [Sphingobacterium multivorum]|uniref:hypothetical protein n=1 Tax=Sphingobacterium multivorum TaxID=28454 RepID=UPI0031BA9029